MARRRAAVQRHCAIRAERVSHTVAKVDKDPCKGERLSGSQLLHESTLVERLTLL